MAEDEVSRLVTLAWGVEVAPQRGPKRELSHERIVEAAMEIADAEGLPAVTMQRVAQSFGFTTMAIYRYVASKDDLQQLMLDASVSGGAWPVESDDWRVGLEQWALQVRDIYVQHPWALEIPLSMEALLMPGQMRAVDAGMRALRTLAGPASAKLAVLMAISVHVRGFAAMEREIGADDHIGESTRRLVREAATGGRMPDLEPLVTSGAYFGEAGEDEAADDLGFTLSMLLPGVEQVMSQMQPAPKTPVERTPAHELAAAESELESVIALRKATQRRASELERAESRARTARDRAKAAAKADAKGR